MLAAGDGTLTLITYTFDIADCICHSLGRNVLKRMWKLFQRSCVSQ